MPPIPEPDYSSDEDENKGAKSEFKSEDRKHDVENGECKSVTDASGHPAVKLTTTATLVLKSSSPCPPQEVSTSAISDSVQNKGFNSKNMFEELREQSAKITSSARLRFASNRQNSQDGNNRLMKRMSSQDESQQPVNNVMKNVAEFEKRLGKDQLAGHAATTNGTSDPNAGQMRMSKS